MNNNIKVLTNSERRVCLLACKGLTNGQIAKKTGLSQRTVEGYRLTAYRKLGIPSQTDMLREKLGYTVKN